MKEVPQNVSEAVKKLNPHLYKELHRGMICLNPQPAKPPKRIRQSAKPLMNKLEGRLLNHLSVAKMNIHIQAITFRLANGVRYTPDFFCFAWPWKGSDVRVSWEAKGPWFTDDAKVKLKVFAAAYPEIVVLLASEDDDTGIWTFQEVWP